MIKKIKMERTGNKLKCYHCFHEVSSNHFDNRGVPTDGYTCCVCRYGYWYEEKKDIHPVEVF